MSTDQNEELSGRILVVEVNSLLLNKTQLRGSRLSMVAFTDEHRSTKNSTYMPFVLTWYELFHFHLA